MSKRRKLKKSDQMHLNWFQTNFTKGCVHQIWKYRRGTRLSICSRIGDYILKLADNEKIIDDSKISYNQIKNIFIKPFVAF